MKKDYMKNIIIFNIIMLMFFVCGCSQKKNPSTEEVISETTEPKYHHTKTDEEKYFDLTDLLYDYDTSMQDNEDIYDIEYLYCITERFPSNEYWVYSTEFIIDFTQNKIYNGILGVYGFNDAKAVSDISDDDKNAILSVLDDMDFHHWERDKMASGYAKPDAHCWNLYIILDREQKRTLYYECTQPGTEQEEKFSEVYDMVDKLCHIDLEYY